MTRALCLYHSADLDGKCSAAIYLKANPGIKLYGIDYGEEPPWDEIAGSDLVVLDWSFQPWPQFAKAVEQANSLLWIDHHKSAIDEWFANASSEQCAKTKTVLDEASAACLLVWKYCFPGKWVPYGVELLHLYDIWDHSDPDVLYYQLGLRNRDNDPTNAVVWSRVLRDCKYDGWTLNVLGEGRILLRYDRATKAAIATKCWFPLEFAGHVWQACNYAVQGSDLLDSVRDKSKYQGVLTFGWRRDKWVVSLYSDDPSVDCGAIAKSCGGGGHRGAAGFACKQLPFVL